MKIEARNENSSELLEISATYISTERFLLFCIHCLKNKQIQLSKFERPY